MNRQSSFLEDFAPGRADNVFVEFNVTANAIVLVGPDTLVGRSFQQQNIIPVSEKDKHAGNRLVSLARTLQALVIPSH
jgi:hypothetical protein